MYENAIIFGAKWFSTEWNPSKQLVWSRGEACLMPLTRLLFFKAEHTFSYATESVLNTTKDWLNISTVSHFNF